MIDRPDQKTNDNCKSKSPKKLNHHKLEACTRPFIILKKTTSDIRTCLQHK